MNKKQKRLTGIMDIAQRIVERDLHVSATVRAAAYYVIGRLREKRATYWAMPREERRALWQGARFGALSNRELYSFVMRGCR